MRKPRSDHRIIGPCALAFSASCGVAPNFDLLRNVVCCLKRFFTGGGRFVPVTNFNKAALSGPFFLAHAVETVRACGCAIGTVRKMRLVLMGRGHLGSSVMKKKAKKKSKGY
jgi:hypothetical protein